MTAAESLAAGICPHCRGTSIKIEPDYISCPCGIHGNPAVMQWCERVPVFLEVAKENVWQAQGQLYKDGERMFTFAGTVAGCGRVLVDGRCVACRPFLPTPADRPSRKAKRKSGKDLAAGEGEEEVAV